jgi:hypothetical protein
MKKLTTVKLIQQMNGYYKIQIFDGSILAREETNLELKDAALRIEQIMEESRNATS